MDAIIREETPESTLIFNHNSLEIEDFETKIEIEGQPVTIKFEEFDIHDEIKEDKIRILMLKGEKGDPGGGGGTDDYDQLINRPRINSVTLTQNKTWSDLGLDYLTNTEIENLLT